MCNRRFYKRERLCSKIDIDRLFPNVATGGRRCCATTADAAVSSVMAYPWRAVWAPGRDSGRVDFPRLLIVVPKRRLRHAVDRATMRRRMREAYRCNRSVLTDGIGGVDLGLIYVADKPTTVDRAHSSLQKIFKKIRLSLNPAGPEPQTPDETVAPVAD